MLISYNKNKFTTYVGYTNNIKKRVILHNASKGAKFTRGRKWNLIYKKTYSTKKDAIKNEFILKKNYKLRTEIKKKYLKKNENINFTTL